MLRKWNFTVASEVQRIWLISQTVLPSEAHRRISNSDGVSGLPHKLRRLLTALGTVYDDSNDSSGRFIASLLFIG
jgi:hypothetical protein